MIFLKFTLVLLLCSSLLFQFSLAFDSDYAFAAPIENCTLIRRTLQNVAGIEQFVAKLNESNAIPGLLMGISYEGKPLFTKAWGVADLPNRLPMKLSTKFRIAALSKTFTSVLIGQLVDRGLVSYDDPISKYLTVEQYPRKSWGAYTVNQTIGQLLSNTAGLSRSDVNKVFTQLHPVLNVMETLKYFKDDPLLYKPGTTFEHTTVGFQLLGAIIESVTGQSFQEVASEFFKINGLADTSVAGYGLSSNVLQYYAGYDLRQHLEPNEFNSTKNFSSAPFDDIFLLNGNWPSAGLISTVGDMLHYGQLLVNAYHRRQSPLLSNSTLQQMWSKQASIEWQGAYVEADYGLGWMVSRPVDRLRYQPKVWHKGGLLGSSSFLVIYPEEQIVAVAFANKGMIELDELVIRTVEDITVHYQPVKCFG